MVRLFLGGVELFDKSRGGDETCHKYPTHSEWHSDIKFVGLLKVGSKQVFQKSSLKKPIPKKDDQHPGIALPLCVGEGSVR